MLKAERRTAVTAYASILMLSAWGFAVVIASFTFVSIDSWLDQRMSIPPAFTLGLFFLVLFLCIVNLYREAWIKRKEV